MVFLLKCFINRWENVYDDNSFKIKGVNFGVFFNDLGFFDRSFFRFVNV